MLRPRVIPCLLLRHDGLVKTRRFRQPRYLGDPINAVRIFNEKEVDELVFLDIAATPERRPPALDVVERIAGECFMPLCYGGGVTRIEEMRALFAAGVEKVAVDTRAVEDPHFVRRAADAFGSQSVVGAIDVAHGFWTGPRVVVRGGRSRTGLAPAAHAERLAREGVGEILLTSVDREGTRQGYDLDLVRAVTSAVDVPVVANGGAGTVADLASAVLDGGAAAAAAGTMFVFEGRHQAVLISFPTPQEIDAAFARKPRDP